VHLRCMPRALLAKKISEASLFSYVMLCSLAQRSGEDVTFIFRELHHPVERLCHKGVDETVASTKDPTYHMSFP